MIDKRLTATEKKKIKPVKQGGGMNYFGKQETVTVPKKWLSDPDHVVAELAYITPREQKILLDANIYGSLDGKPNKGPGGIMSLQGDMGSVGGGSSSGGGGNNDRPNPHTKSGTSKTSTRGPKSYDGPGNIHGDDPKAPPAYEIIGGTKYDVTPDTRKERELARMKQTIVEAPLPNVTPKGTEYYNPTTGTLLGFAPQQKKFGLLDLALIAATGGLFGTKLATGAKMFNTAKNVSKFAETIGLTDKNVVNAFTSNFMDKVSNLGLGKKSTKNTTTKDEDIFTGGGDGIEGLGNNDALNQEYLLLLNKFNTGVFTDADQVRFTFLQKVLGK